MSFDPATSTLVERLERDLSRWGAKHADPNGVVVEHDGAAPRLVQFGSGDEPECCDPHHPEEPDPGQGVTGGIRISLTASYRGSDDNPVRRVCVKPLLRSGSIPLGGPSAGWRPTHNEQRRSEKESISHTFEICVPCSYFTSDHSVRFELQATDRHDNLSIQIVGIAVGADQFAECCGN